jgi:hypothetical protein
MRSYAPPPDLDEFLDSTFERHRCVQRAIATLANEELGARLAPQGIQRAEGGVKIRGAEVKIKKSSVSGPPGCEAEERAVVNAITRVIELWRTGNKALPDHFCERGWVMGDPLRSFYSPRPVEQCVGLPDA